MLGIDWGDVPTWLATVFSGGAFTGALLLLRVEAGRDRQRQVDDREAQARLVTAWMRYAREGEGAGVVFAELILRLCV